MPSSFFSVSLLLVFAYVWCNVYLKTKVADYISQSRGFQSLNPFVSNAPFLYLLKTSENRTNELMKIHIVGFYLYENIWMMWILGPKSRPFLIYQPTAINQKPVMMNLWFYNEVMVFYSFKGMLWDDRKNILELSFLKVTSATKRSLLKMCHLRHWLRIFLFRRKIMFRSLKIFKFLYF